ncbi:unnamed protein product [Allacma fusca]|uniref:Uncharacterized protein n=1 Tax=Allacma fusca TaxID=39272 RepID=A0A8J2Q382_9HEXA|nr:unnamed protein product [Allacma fusca]
MLMKSKNAGRNSPWRYILDLLVDDFSNILMDDEIIVNSTLGIYNAALKPESMRISSFQSASWKYVLPMKLLSVKETEAMLKCWNNLFRSVGNNNPEDKFCTLPRKYSRKNNSGAVPVGIWEILPLAFSYRRKVKAESTTTFRENIVPSGQ